MALLRASVGARPAALDQVAFGIGPLTTMATARAAIHRFLLHRFLLHRF